MTVAVALLLGLAFLGITDASLRRDGLAGIAALDIVLITVLSLASRVSVSVSSEGLMVRRVFGARVLTWAEITGLVVKPSGEEGPMSRVVLQRGQGMDITLPGFRFRREQRNALSLLAEGLNGLVAFYRKNSGPEGR
jgi:hypothetical protein